MRSGLIALLRGRSGLTEYKKQNKNPFLFSYAIFFASEQKLFLRIVIKTKKNKKKSSPQTKQFEGEKKMLSPEQHSLVSSEVH